MMDGQYRPPATVCIFYGLFQVLSISVERAPIIDTVKQETKNNDGKGK